MNSTMIASKSRLQQLHIDKTYIDEVEAISAFVREYEEMGVGFCELLPESTLAWQLVSLFKKDDVYQKLVLGSALFMKLRNRSVESEFIEWCIKNVRHGHVGTVRKALKNGDRVFKDHAFRELDENLIRREVFNQAYKKNLIKILPKHVNRKA